MVLATQLDTLQAFSRTVTAQFSHLCYFCSLILNFPLGGVCWAEKAAAGQRVTAVSKSTRWTSHSQRASSQATQPRPHDFMI